MSNDEIGPYICSKVDGAGNGVVVTVGVAVAVGLGVGVGARVEARNTKYHKANPIMRIAMTPKIMILPKGLDD